MNLRSLVEELQLEIALQDLDIDLAQHKVDDIEFEELADLYFDDPIGFFEDILGFYPDKDQKEVAIAVRDNKRTSVRSGQGVGKTAIVACIIIWYMMFRPKAKVIATAPTASQLGIVLWPEINKWLNDSILYKEYLETTKTFIYRIGYNDWFGTAKTAAKKENMLGLHADNLLIVVDEAPGVEDEILEALLGTITGVDNKILMIGNPTKNSGIFYDSHHTLKEDFYTVHIDASKVERTDKKQHEILIKKYGIDSNVVRVLIHGKFPLEEDDVFIQLPKVMRAVNNDINIPKIPSTLDIAVDCARYGEDETVIGCKIDFVVPPFITHKGKKTTLITKKVKMLAYQLHDKYPNIVIPIKVDVGGLGGGPVDQLKDWIIEENIKWAKIVPVAFGIPIKHKYYYDTTTYMAGNVKDLLPELKLPNDSDLIGQLSTRKYIFKKDKIKLESKDDMKKRKLPSPDRADCLFLLCLNVKAKFLEKVR